MTKKRNEKFLEEKISDAYKKNNFRRRAYDHVGKPKTKPNIKIREALKKYNMRQWELAQLLDMGETTLTRMLRVELPNEKTEKIISVIKNHG